MLDMRIYKCQWFDSVMMQIRMYQRTRNEHRDRTGDYRSDAQIARDGALAEDPHLDGGLRVIQCEGDRKVYTAVYQAGAYTLEDDQVEPLSRGEGEWEGSEEGLHLERVGSEERVLRGDAGGR